MTQPTPNGVSPSRVLKWKRPEGLPAGNRRRASGLPQYPTDSGRRDVGVSQSTEKHPPRTTVRKVIDADHGPVWRVTFACGCTGHDWRTWNVAVMWAFGHCCPRPWSPVRKPRRAVR